MHVNLLTSIGKVVMVKCKKEKNSILVKILHYIWKMLLSKANYNRGIPTSLSNIVNYKDSAVKSAFR